MSIEKDALLFHLLSKEENLRLLTKLHEGPLPREAFLESDEELSLLQEASLIRIQDGSISINKVGKFHALAVLQRYLTTTLDVPSCGQQ